jgi:hypothetical protein
MSEFAPRSTVRTWLLAKVAVAATFYIGLVQALSWFIATHAASRWSPMVATIPILLALAVVTGVMSRLNGRDEREARMHLEALAFAFLASQMLLPTYVFMVYSGLVDLQLEMFMPTMALLWLLGLARSMWKYR